eukprot:g4835.t1
MALTALQQNAIETAQNDFLCPLCQKILESPVCLGCCSHVFCDKCIREALVFENVCPVPGCKLPTKPSDIATLHAMDALCGHFKELAEQMVALRDVNAKISEKMQRKRKRNTPAAPTSTSTSTTTSTSTSTSTSTTTSISTSTTTITTGEGTARNEQDLCETAAQEEKESNEMQDIGPAVGAEEYEQIVMASAGDGETQVDDLPSGSQWSAPALKSSNDIVQETPQKISAGEEDDGSTDEAESEIEGDAETPQEVMPEESPQEEGNSSVSQLHGTSQIIEEKARKLERAQANIALLEEEILGEGPAEPIMQSMPHIVLTNLKNSTRYKTRERVHAINRSMSNKQKDREWKRCKRARMAQVQDDVNEFTTHIVTGCKQASGLKKCQRTAKYLAGVAAGIWIVTPEWIDASEKAGRWVDEAPFEIAGGCTDHNVSGPHRSRIAAGTGQPRLFHGLRMVFARDYLGALPGLGVKRQATLAMKLGATIIDRRKMSQEKVDVVICPPGAKAQDLWQKYGKDMPFVTHLWLIDSIGSYKVMDFKNYMVLHS